MGWPFPDSPEDEEGAAPALGTQGENPVQDPKAQLASLPIPPPLCPPAGGKRARLTGEQVVAQLAVELVFQDEEEGQLLGRHRLA